MLYRALRCISCTLAIIAFLLPVLCHEEMEVGLTISCVLSIVWAIATVWALYEAGKQARWLLIWLPLVVYWPGLSWFFDWACRTGRECL